MEQYREMIPFLLHWYQFHARVLPWREDPSAYHVWVSEIMLQQTKVEAVRGYYMRFLDELPDVRALAECPEDRLMKLWEGLGYYSRVRNLQKAARIVCEQYDGELPDSAEELRKLPGIGDYTAGAIASIAFRKPEPSVDGNLLRVLSRLTGSRDNILLPEVKRQMAAELREVMPGEQSGALNQALMDLGATVCVPNGEPHCEECPLMHMCTAFHDGTVAEIPVRSAKKERRSEEKLVFIVVCGEKLLLHRRDRKGLLAGLWEYPNTEGSCSAGKAAEALRKILPEVFPKRLSMKKLEPAKHIFSHVEWHMDCRFVNVPETAKTELPEGYVWATKKELETEYSLPSAFRKWKVDKLY